VIEPLKYLSEAKLAELRNSVSANLARYEWGDFADLLIDNGWAIESQEVKVDTDLLAQLNESLASPQQDADASVIVHQALQGMTPAMAAEERVWARLTHVECLAYSQARWIRNASDERVLGAIRTHMFAAGIQGIRDDNAVSRLWWNMHIATIADPSDPQGALRLILRRADTRLSFVERTGTASRSAIARAVIRAMRRHDWLQSSEAAFRHFMIVLNREGGGVLFESLSDDETDVHMERCVLMARNREEKAT
jgi:hypothetical protein